MLSLGSGGGTDIRSGYLFPAADIRFRVPGGRAKWIENAVYLHSGQPPWRAPSSVPERREGREAYRARDEHRRAAGPRSARGWGGVRYTVATASSGVCVTAVVVV